jgi:hypothetical protein
MLVALAALVLALTGSAIAGLHDRGGSKKVIKSIARKQVQKLAPGLTVMKAGTAEHADSATHAESASAAATATHADTATRADSAGLADAAAKVGGLEVKEIDYQSQINNGVVRSIVDYTGIFRIDAQCANVGDGLDITAFTAVDDSKISMMSSLAVGADDTDTIRHIRSESDFDLDTNETFAIDNRLVPLLNPPLGIRQATIWFSTPSGFTATIQLQLAFLGANNSCLITGTSIGG